MALMKELHLNWNWLASLISVSSIILGLVLMMVRLFPQVVERERVETDLRLSKSSLAEAQRIAHLGSYEWGVAADTLFWSDETYRIFGLEMNEFEPSIDGFVSFVHPEDRAAVKAAIDRALETGEPYEASFRIVRADGEERIVQDHGEVGFDDSGRAIRFRGAILDITERAQAEKELAKKTNLLDGLVQHSQVIITIKDPQGRYILVNPEFERSVGTAADEIKGKTAHDIFPSATAAEQEDLERRALESGKPTIAETELPYHGGAPHSYVTTKVPVYDSDGKPVAVGTMALDISDRKSAEERVRRYFEAPLVGAAIYGPDKSWIQINDKFCDLLGYSRQELTKLTWTDVTHPDDLAENRRHFDQALAGERETYSLDKRFIRKDGETVFAGVSVQCVRKSNGDPDYFILLVQDITDRKLAQQEIMALNEELERRVEARTAELRAAQEELVRNERLAALGQLTGTVSHELRNPLGAMRTSVAAIRKLASDGEPMLQRAAQVVDRSVSRCDNIISDLLDYSRTRPLDRAPRMVDDWLGGLLDEYALPDGVELRRELDCPVSADLDAGHLGRSVTNLLQNACQAMTGPSDSAQAGPRVLTAASRLVDGTVEILVADTGPGIAPEDLPRIFDPLFSTKSFGVGLGLALVKRTVEQHDGTVEAVSDEGRGARFVLRLPVTAAERSEAS